MGSIGVGELAVLGVVALMAIPTLWALIDILRTPEDAWRRAGQQQIVWLVVVLFGGVIGAVVYVLMARGKLKS
jgi:hypothetical protein